jgi:O-acetylserine/cysteine efflux transporter
VKPLDFSIMMLCCLAWAGNFVVSAWALGNHPVPPFMLAAVRAAIVLLFMGWVLLKPRPRHFWRLMAVCACVGPVHLGFLYTGLQTAPASGGSIVSQMLIPFAAVLSVIFLKERIGPRRIAAIVGAIIGVVIMIYEPGALRFDLGLVYIVLAYLSLAVGSVVMKRVGNVDWTQYVTWMALVVLIVMAPASYVFEAGQAEVWARAKAPLLIAAGYAALAVTVLAHGQYFTLIKRYEISVVVPLTLMTTVFACVLGVIFLKETLFMRYLIGGAIIMPCVWFIAARQEAALNTAKPGRGSHHHGREK